MIDDVRKTGPAWPPRTAKNLQDVQHLQQPGKPLSTPSISPRPDDEKNQSLRFTETFFPTRHHRLAPTVPLTDLENDLVNSLHAGRDTRPPAPPVHVENISKTTPLPVRYRPTSPTQIALPVG